METIDLLDPLSAIPPEDLSYTEWVSVGMGLKEAGYTASDWDSWSRQDVQRYHPNECEKKWATFSGSSTPVTAGTIVQMATQRGWKPKSTYTGGGYELDWGDTIGDDCKVVNHNWLEPTEIHMPTDWNAPSQLITYLETLFESGEQVGYVTTTWERDGKHLPNKGSWSRTAGDLIEELSKCNGDIGKVLGDYNPEAGAWIRFNPLDGKGCKNENVTDFRYALVESDSMPIEEQNAIIRAMELPVACLVHSGGKSLHAIVRIEATNYEEYRKRVDYLYEACKKNGLDIDRQNRNPSRLSRMPGIMRKGEKQYIVDKNIGKGSWGEWKDWLESVNDDLPDSEGLADVWDKLPDLSPPLIDVVLRQGHKLLLAGPSKAGKSYALIELCIAVAEGRSWLGFHCTKGKILYVNLELDRASCLHRFKDVYTALGWRADNLQNIDIWNLRGRSVPMDKLAPKLIRRAMNKGYIAIVIDPIYKVITGDENSADQMAQFCNQFDKVCTELGCAVIYCHHHSKGSQGSKRSMDRASGSGVFARDPDALLDLMEIDLPETLLDQEKNNQICGICRIALEMSGELIWVSEDDLCSRIRSLEACKKWLSTEEWNALQRELEEVDATLRGLTGWRLEGTLREFPRFDPVSCWFRYPIHKVDNSGVLNDAYFKGTVTNSKGVHYPGNFAKKKTSEERADERKVSFEMAIDACEDGGKILLDDLVSYLGKCEKTVRNRIKDHGGFTISEGEVHRKST